jgi:feruloyl esterase
MVQLPALWLSMMLSTGILTLAQDDFPTKCEKFGSRIHLPNVKVNFATYIPGGTNLTLVDNPSSCGETSQVVLTDTCRVAMAVKTSNESQITLEAWFPKNYTGRFLSTGNGGISGCV